MEIDIRTLAFFLSITDFLQVIALFAQSWANKIYRGLLWWAFGGLAGGLAFAFNYLRNTPGFGATALWANNLLFACGLVFPYIGIRQFFDQRIRFKWLSALVVIFGLLIFYFAFENDNAIARRFLTSGTVALFSFLIARSFLRNSIRSIRLTAWIMAMVFLFNALFFSFRALVGDYFSQTAIYLIILTNSTLWTYGFIIMVNQRLYDETHEAQKQAELIFNTSPDAVLVMRLANNQIVMTNDSFTAITGYTRSEVVNSSLQKLNLWQNPDDEQKMKAELSERGLCENLEVVFQRKDGSQLWGIISAKIIVLQGAQHVISIFHDISERKRLEDELHQQATTDGLTGVANRRYFLEQAHAEIVHAIHLQRPLSMALIDIDHFKKVNDTYGHAVGDQALMALAHVCRKNIREIDLFARFGGDEFVLLLPGATIDQAYEVVKRISLILNGQPLELDGKTVTLTISVGLSSLSEDHHDFDALLRQADQALYNAKEAGRNRIFIENNLLTP